MTRSITEPSGAQQEWSVVGMIGLLFIAGCGIDGGLNQNQHTPGNEEDGTSLSIGDIAIDPSGQYFISNNADQIIHGDIATGSVTVLPGVEKAHRLAFGRPDKIFITSSGESGKLISYDVAKKTVDWEMRIFLFDLIIGDWQRSYPLIQVTDDHQQLVLVDSQRLRVLSTATGKPLHDLSFDENIIDVDLHPDGERIIVTLDNTWRDGIPNTEVVVYSIKQRSRTIINVPNCSDELELAAGGATGLLAPTRCAQPDSGGGGDDDEYDPVSVIDFSTHTFVRNLPGFGPTAVTPDGLTAVAFMDLDNLDESLFDNPEDIPTDSDSRYQLMFIDVRTLQFDSMEIGDNLPRYAMTPSEQILLVDADTWFNDARIRLLDIPTRQLHMVAGPDVRLNNYVITSDSSRALLLDDGLYDLSVLERVVSSVPLLFTPKNLNITPDDSKLLLREDKNLLWVYDIAAQDVVLPISIDGETS